MNEFLLNDGTINSYGFVVLTEGIDLVRFRKNPVMFYNHQRKLGVIGRWENLRIENGKLYGTPVFDDKHEPGKTIKEKVESGFLKGASMGIEVLAMEDINGVKTAVKSVLSEVSICDIPSNENALQLYFKDTPVSDLSTYMQLSLNVESSKGEIQSLKEALGLSHDSTLHEALYAIAELKKNNSGGNNIDGLLQTAFIGGYISDTERSLYKSAFQGKPGELEAFLKEKKAEKEAKLTKEYNSIVVILRNKVSGFSQELIEGELKALAMNDMGTFRELVERMPNPVKPSTLLGMGNRTKADASVKDKQDWTLEDYRKNAPHELKQNPKLFEELLKKEGYKS